LDVILIKINFTVWMKWIKECIGTVKTSVFVNRSHTIEFSFQNGLRRRDPLSLLIFLIAVEGLNLMMKASIDTWLFSGYKVGDSNILIISHLQFVDDTLLIGRSYSFWDDIWS